MGDARRSFGPVALLGVGSSALAAVAGAKPWTEVEPPGGDCSLGYAPGLDFDSLARDAPLAGALALVMLAAWGVVLVTRGRARRAVAVVAALVAAGYLATAVTAYSTLKEATVREVTEQFGDPGNGCPAASVWMNNDWWLAALVAGVVALVAAVLAAVLMPAWPEMGTRYDAPGGPASAAAPTRSDDPRDLWKALDEGSDPTQD